MNKVFLIIHQFWKLPFKVSSQHCFSHALWNISVFIIRRALVNIRAGWFFFSIADLACPEHHHLHLSSLFLLISEFHQKYALFFRWTGWYWISVCMMQHKLILNLSHTQRHTHLERISATTKPQLCWWARRIG